ncbi:MAG: 4Fe-4S binding protein [Candidatus Omnitrophica bacterium]|nr:4Fe-4S binding protein [Candidatus Omnitrophota bacterium]MCM8768669.1 4Fe-4S binding protein [Candidatus Omnitrophota bacterium]
MKTAEEKKSTWKELPEGDVLEGASSLQFKTGNWRSIRPVHHPEKCIHCLLCWIACPDSAIKVKDGRFQTIDYDYCKGCGICSHECPKKAIEMVPEKK